MNGRRDGCCFDHMWTILFGTVLLFACLLTYALRPVQLIIHTIVVALPTPVELMMSPSTVYRDRGGAATVLASFHGIPSTSYLQGPPSISSNDHIDEFLCDYLPHTRRSPRSPAVRKLCVWSG